MLWTEGVQAMTGLGAFCELQTGLAWLLMTMVFVLSDGKSRTTS